MLATPARIFDSPISLSRIHRGLEEDGFISVNKQIASISWRNIKGSNIVKIPVYEIKEIRKLADNLCVRISWGTSFVLKYIILKATNQEDINFCIRVTETASQVLGNQTYEENFHSYITEQFFSMVDGDKITNVERYDIEMLKRFAEKINFELNPHFFNNSFFQQGKLSLQEWLEYISSRIYHSQEHLLKDLRINSNASLISQYADELTKLISSRQMAKFLLTEQKLQKGALKKEQKLFFTPCNDNISSRQFLDYLFSERNEITDRQCLNIINYSMQHPLSHYWIASSHNTYLNGDQLMSESSEEAYIRVLRKGCRCVELDCWPGDEDNIVIYHGNTATTKISFESVLHAIKEHAFVTSKYPLILSIEDHCDVKLQKKMAKMFQEIFGELLLVEPVRSAESELPSPSELMMKIIIKHKKIPKGETQATLSQDDFEEPIKTAPKAGVLYRKLNNIWIMCMVSIDNSQLFYEQYIEKQEVMMDDPVDRHWSEIWFHGVLPGGISDGFKILDNAPVKENGVFLVGIVLEEGNEKYFLFSWQNGYAIHNEISQIWQNNNIVCTLNGKDCFSTIYNLIADYQYFPAFYNYPILTTPVPQINAHEKMHWFHPSLSKEDVCFVMTTVNENGSFLVRRSSQDQQNLVLALWVNNCLKEFKISKVDNGFIIGRKKVLFENVVEIIKRCQETPLLWTLITNPISREKAQQILNNPKMPDDVVDRMASLEPVRPTSGENQQLSRSSSSEASENDELDTGRCFGLHHAQLEQLQTDHSCCYPFGFSLKSPKGYIEFWTSDKDAAANWMIKLSKAIENSSMPEKDEQATNAIGQELSALVIYCQSAMFKETEHLQNGGNPVEIYSHSETKMNTLITNHASEILNFHKNYLSRIFPHGLRVTSSNYDPLPFWISGCQMVALNYQTEGGEYSSMQVNDAWFERGGRCGYVLKPKSHFIETPDPNSNTCLFPIYIEIIVLGARNLNLPNKKGHQAAVVKMKILGHPRDTKPSNTYKVDLEGTALSMSCFPPSVAELSSTKKIEISKFFILNPEYALLKFNVLGRNALTKLVSVGQSIHLIEFLREGYRSVPLKNDFSEKIHLSSLLIHLRVWRQNEIYHKLKDLETNLKKTKNFGRERIKKAIKKLQEVIEIFSKESVI